MTKTNEGQPATDPQLLGPLVEREAARVMFRWYQREALRTASKDGAPMPPWWYLCLGLCGESGEVAELVKKAERHGFPLNRERLRDELGDVLWYLTVLAASAGIDLDEVAVANVGKLRARYPDGFVERGPAGPSGSDET